MRASAELMEKKYKAKMAHANAASIQYDGSDGQLRHEKEVKLLDHCEVRR